MAISFAPPTIGWFPRNFTLKLTSEMKSIYILYLFFNGLCLLAFRQAAKYSHYFFRIIIPLSPIPYAPRSEQMYLQANTII